MLYRGNPLTYLYILFVIKVGKKQIKKKDEIREEMVREYYRYYRLLNPSEEDT